jgi:hypothetical protein
MRVGSEKPIRQATIKRREPGIHSDRAMMTRFGWMWMLAGLAVVASAAGPKTFRMPDSVLLFGNYNEIRIVTAEGERLVRPPVDVKFNGGYFAFPSLAPSGEFVVWGFATESHVAWPDVRIHFALGVYSIAQQRWKTYGDFETIAMPPFLPTRRRSPGRGKTRSAAALMS